MRALLLAPVCLLSACVATTPQPMPSTPASYEQIPSDLLWNRLTLATYTREMMLLEAELAARGETSSGAEYLGRRTIAGVGVPTYQRSAGAGSDRDCADFSSSAEAQRFFLSAGGPFVDAHGLDRDGDGYACEFGQTLRASAARHKTKPLTPARRTATIRTSDQCFVGPRGGTYTITASGNKNYDGC